MRERQSAGFELSLGERQSAIGRSFEPSILEVMEVDKPDNFMDDKIAFRRVSDKDVYEVKPDTFRWVVARYLRRSLTEFVVRSRFLSKVCGRFVEMAPNKSEGEMFITGPELMRLTKLRIKETAKRFPRCFYDGFGFIEGGEKSEDYKEWK